MPAEELRQSSSSSSCGPAGSGMDVESALIEVLMTEARQHDEDEIEDREQQLMLENGVDWCPGELARQGDEKEVKGLFEKGVFRVAGKQKPEGRYISMRMIRRWKGESIKSRLCLQDVAYKKAYGGEMFAATPSLTALRLALAIASLWRSQGTDVKIIVGDVTQAFVHADMDEKIVTTVPKDLDGLVMQIDGQEIVLHEGDFLEVLKALYGYRRSPRLWQHFFFDKIEKSKTVSMKGLLSEPALYVDMIRKVISVVHVDDILAIGAPIVDEFFKELTETVLLREVGRLVQNDDKVTFLGRTITRTAKGYQIEASQVIIDAIVREASVQDSKKVDTPAVKYTKGQLEQARDLDATESTAYRSLLGKEMYVSWDRPDIQFATSTAARSGVAPTTVDEMKLKRIAKYLHHRRRLRWKYELEEFKDQLFVYTDSDWAGDQETRKSMSGGVLCLGTSVLKTWAKRQAIVALSSAEAEYMAIIKGVQEALAVRTALIEMGMPVQVNVLCDSSAAKGSAEKQGLMHMKHMQLRELFLKRVVEQGLVRITKIGTLDNLSNPLTKAVDAKMLRKLWELKPEAWDREFEVNSVECLSEVTVWFEANMAAYEEVPSADWNRSRNLFDDMYEALTVGRIISQEFIRPIDYVSNSSSPSGWQNPSSSSSDSASSWFAQVRDPEPDHVPGADNSVTNEEIDFEANYLEVEDYDIESQGDATAERRAIIGVGHPKCQEVSIHSDVEESFFQRWLRRASWCVYLIGLTTITRWCWWSCSGKDAARSRPQPVMQGFTAGRAGRRTVGTQSQTTYCTRGATSRFTPLGGQRQGVYDCQGGRLLENNDKEMLGHAHDINALCVKCGYKIFGDAAFCTVCNRHSHSGCAIVCTACRRWHCDECKDSLSCNGRF